MYSYVFNPLQPIHHPPSSLVNCGDGDGVNICWVMQGLLLHGFIGQVLHGDVLYEC